MLPAAHGLLSDRKNCALVAIPTWDVSYMLYVSKCRYIPNGCEVDIRIPESFPEESLKEFILAFAKVSILELNLICKEFYFTNSAVSLLHRVKLDPTWPVWPVEMTGHMNSPTLASSSLTWSAIAWEAGQTSLWPCSQSIRSSTSAAHSSDHTRNDGHY